MTPRQIVSVVALAALSLLLTVAPASADSYRYWSFWKGTGSGWAYQESGPNTYVPADGSVDGWRFGVSPDSTDAEKPRSAPDFAAICAHTPAAGGRKRVAVVIDYGTAADAGSATAPPAPVSRCVSLPEDASSAQLLAQIAPPLRYDSNGLLCSISGYPQSGCGQVVSGDAAAATGAAGTAAASSATAAPSSGASTVPAVPQSRKSGKAAGWAIGAVLIAVLAGASYWQSRRRR